MRLSLPSIVLIALALAGCNEPPGAPVVAIEPAEPVTADGLSVVIVQDSVDPNKNDTVSYTYTWRVDGAVVAALTGTEVPADRTKRGDIWSVTVTPADDKETGPVGTASITIGNTAPTAAVEITPDAPLSTDDLIAQVTTDDVDGDTVNTTVSWKVDGEDARISTERVPADRTRRGQVWEVTVLPKDARSTGEAVTASKQIANQPPVVDAVRIRPDKAYEASLLEVVVDAHDNDGDDLTYAATWRVNGVDLTEITDLELDGSYFDKGDEVEVSIVANDGLLDSAPVSSEVRTILNTPPTLTSVTITPAEAFEGDTLTCTAAGFADVDGDPEGYIYEWRVDGTVVGSSTTLGSEAFGRGDRVSCAVIPFDGVENGLSVSARPLVISNTPPEVATITIGPADPMTGTTITSSVTGAFDIDDDAVRLDIDWYVEGRKVASGASLAGTSYVKFQDIYAEVRPYDGTDYGSPVKSNTLTSTNAPPKIDTWVLAPTTLYTDATITLTVAASDPDFDSVRLTHDWKLNGTTYGTTSTLSIPSTDITRGDVITLVTTPNDGTIDGATRSGSLTVVNKPPTIPEISIDPSPNADPDESLVCSIDTASVDADEDTLTTVMTWYRDGVKWTGKTSTTTRSGDTIPSTETDDQETWECEVTVNDGYVTVTATEEVRVSSRDGQVRKTDGTWIDFKLAACGSGRSCSGTDAEKACEDLGMKVASHASNGTTKVASLGASASCGYSVSYFEMDTEMGSSDCLVAISNLEWSSCCGTTSWHGNTLSFASPGTVFGNVRSGDSGFSSSYTNRSGTTWGCFTKTSTASSSTSCSTLYVACVD